jgi:hypothetical protein
MNNNKLKVAVAYCAALTVLGSSSALALTPTQRESVRQEVTAVPAVELAAKAAELVAKAAKADKEAVAVAAVRAAASKSPGATLAVVSSLITLHPACASQVVAAAVEALPDQAESIAKIATIAAPDQSEKIVAAVTKTSPAAAQKVALAVASTASKASVSAKSQNSLARAVRSAATAGGGIIIVTNRPIDPRAYSRPDPNTGQPSETPVGSFPSTSKLKDVSNYAAPGTGRQ